MEHAINLEDMENKAYNNFKEFEEDLKWFTFFIRTNTLSTVTKKAARSLLKFATDEIISILSCEECFLKAYEYGVEAAFLMPCQSPHILLWAQLKDYGLWPSKAMWVAETDKLVNVRFFGDHTTATLSAANCKLFSEDHPTTQLDGTGLEGYQHAMNVSLDVLHVFLIQLNFLILLNCMNTCANFLQL